MKKFLGRILGIIFVLILGCQQVCYADVVIDDGDEEMTAITLLIGFIFATILVVSAISYFSLKLTIKEQSSPDFDAEKGKKLTPEKIEKKKRKIQRKIYICSMILTMVILIVVKLNFSSIFATIGYIEYYSDMYILAVFVLFIISIIIRILKKRKISNIICGIIVVISLVVLIGLVILDKVVGNYNEQFSQYYGAGNNDILYVNYKEFCITDVKGLINTTIENNKKGRKTTIIYEGIEYTTAEELEQLLNRIDINGIYYYTDKRNGGYIEKITLTYDIFSSYEGNKSKSELMELLQIAIAEINKNEDIYIEIRYPSETDDGKVIYKNSYISKKNINDISNLIDEIESRDTYFIMAGSYERYYHYYYYYIIIEH